ncbi:TetR/AcrR family transcriptional regulator [Virgibacillus sp. DJP39]|uniref:TetR/AcrR family transcriptional regulator n=1 Tax=Virgibacillus sp. DJP39 TaxID=3409790 RepID=UPI003BB777D8
MNEKKQKIITTSIDLFAEKGFYTTSIQEITEKSKVSKGAFYLHFHSKDELMLEIFKFYYNLMKENIENAFDQQLSHKENFVKQVEVQFYEILKHKSFITTQLKEQAITLNKDLYEFVRIKEFETQKWYKETLIAIYGKEVEPYVIDAGILCEGMKGRYFQVLIHADLDIDIPELASFIVDCLDDIIVGLLAKNKKPILTEEKMAPIFPEIREPEQMLKNEVVNELLEMQRLLNEYELEEKMIIELQGVIDFLITEVKKSDSKEFVIQGLLANFKGIDQFDKYRTSIAEKLDIRLL